jgi:hypothetical protein
VAKAYKIVLLLRRKRAVKGPKFTVCLLYRLVIVVVLDVGDVDAE